MGQFNFGSETSSANMLALLLEMFGMVFISVIAGAGFLAKLGLEALHIYPEVRVECDPSTIALLDCYIADEGMPGTRTFDGRSVGNGMHVNLADGPYIFVRETDVRFAGSSVSYTIVTPTKYLVRKLYDKIHMLPEGTRRYYAVTQTTEGFAVSHRLTECLDASSVELDRPRQMAVVNRIRETYDNGNGNCSYSFLICGPPGYGKSYVAKCLLGLLQAGQCYPKMIIGFDLTKERLELQLLRQTPHSGPNPLIVLIDEIDVAMAMSVQTAARFGRSDCIAETKASFINFMDELHNTMRHTIVIFTTHKTPAELGQYDASYIRPGRITQIFDWHEPV